ncbi:MAG: flagellin [Phycisphaerae bacterium]|nr:flagellin [Phycisphaerae bacterium]
MAITVNNSNTLNLLGILNKTAQAQSTTLTRMSTGQRINAGKDDPAGLIALRALDAESTATNAAISNNQRTNAMLDVADGALKEVESLLTDIETLVAGSVGDQISDSEKAANQAQIDMAVESIDRIVRTTTFNGKHMLNGQLGIQVSEATGKAEDLRLYSRNPSSSSQDLSVSVTTASSSAALSTTNSATGAMTYTVTGSLGSATIEISDTDALADEIAKINAATSQTGVSAAAGAGNGINFSSVETGSDQFVSIDMISGGGSAGWVDTHVENGSDAVVTVNGQSAAADGNKVSFSANGVSGSFTLTATGDVDAATMTLSVSGGGATFQLGTDSSTRSTMGINSMFSHTLGRSGTGFLSEVKSGGSHQLNASGTKALAIVKEAMADVAEARGRIGGFQKYQVQTSINSLEASAKGLADAKGVINDVDYATETAEMNRQNVLMTAGMQLLGVASQQSGQVLQLL